MVSSPKDPAPVIGDLMREYINQEMLHCNIKMLQRSIKLPKGLGPKAKRATQAARFFLLAVS